jgi:pyridoxal 5'-phosphate synthase pdxT subunit
LVNVKTVGVLALQGDFAAHQQALLRAGAGRVLEVRAAADLAAVDGLVIPGGESTTMLKLIDAERLFEPLREFGAHKPIFGTCAGAILLASEVTHPAQASLALMDIAVQRNAYGRQLDSRVAHIQLDGHELEAVFIRAPIIRRVGPGATVLATYQNDPVLVEQGRHMVATFHPELTSDIRVHQSFLEKL